MRLWDRLLLYHRIFENVKVYMKVGLQKSSDVQEQFLLAIWYATFARPLPVQTPHIKDPGTYSASTKTIHHRRFPHL